MVKKPKFNPVVTRVRLNPEQAVLFCSCFSASRVLSATGTRSVVGTVCARKTLNVKQRTTTLYRTTAASATSS